MIVTRFQKITRASRLRNAFTVFELLVAVSAMTLIVLVLYGVFDQVQKALRGNAAQVDVLEGGRSAMEMMTRELEQMRASGVPGATNLLIELVSMPTRQELLDPGAYRTNVLQEIFFLLPYNKDWSGIGYKVYATNYGVGSLYRFSATTNASMLTSNNLSLAYLSYSLPKYSNVCQRVTDGVVHFRVRAFDTNGFPMTYLTFRTNDYGGGVILTNDLNTVETRYAFTNQGLPAYLELELGILEPHVLERYKAMANTTVASNFLAKQTGKVHLFQQRVPLRTAQ